MRREAATTSLLIHDDATGRSVEPVGFQYAPVDLRRGWVGGNRPVRGNRIGYSVVAVPLVTSCRQYIRNPLSLKIPFKVMADGEQKFLAGCLNAKIANYFKRHNLGEQFASELAYHNYNSVVNNTVLLSDSLDFLHRHGLMEKFLADDDLQFVRLPSSDQIQARHTTALLLGLAQ
jgi:hypothetical protein